ncbi:chitin deacetylase [Mortierella polycephala]|uniref:Chitin deacetylase n=1 Tax=Mortierella polycephala TaxID=41804 RepID=A0A9P6U0R5_9FUNG|nr:chitin deacetylase [Mortierella polycephala]
MKESPSGNKVGRKLSTLTVLGSVALILGLFSSTVEAATAEVVHKLDKSRPAGQSPWPDSGHPPSVNSPEVKAWVKQVDWSKVPKLPIRHTPSHGHAPECPSSHVNKEDCWWTCNGCYAPDDIIDCPKKNVWGLTFDDGPSPKTTMDMLDLLEEKEVNATFFVTGSKSTKAPWLLKETINRGHHLASHTWSHFGLTTLTNEQIVAEFKWTEQFIFHHTGYRIKYYRPPYGDVDNRVRAIARELGFKTVIWTDEWDTQDWQLSEKTITSKQIVGIFKNGLSDIQRRDRGIITLQHDGHQEMVDMARTLLTMGLKNGMQPMNVAQCLGDDVGYNAVPTEPGTKPETRPETKPASNKAPKADEKKAKESTKNGSKDPAPAVAAAVPKPATKGDITTLVKEKETTKSDASRVLVTLAMSAFCVVTAALVL